MTTDRTPGPPPGDRPGPTPAEARLDALLARVDRAVPPARDLWPGIEARLGAARAAPPARRRWPYALAAGVALAAVGTLVALRVTDRAPVPVAALPAEGAPASAAPDRAATPQASSPELVAAAFAGPQDAEYRAARDALERTFRERLDLLQPETRTRILESLELIRRANEDIRQALAEDPSSPMLLNLLDSTRQQEIDLYTNVTRGTDPALQRTRT